MTDLRAKVATILGKQQIAINVGTNSGVRVGNAVTILRPVDILDPDNPALTLGTAMVRKGTLFVESVDAQFAVARVRKLRKAGTNIFLAGPATPEFTITDRGSEDSMDRILVRPGDPVDVELADEDQA